MLILGIETSCDECAVSVVEDGTNILSNVIYSQTKEHGIYNGVVPELASRLHCEWIAIIYKEALEKASIRAQQLDAIAVTTKPGLFGSLLVGVSFAKALAWSMKKPLIAVDHILGHIYAAHLENDIQYPYLALLVSGGHTLFMTVKDFDDFEVLGTTIDDACGEAFDKIAKHLGLGYPGGAIVDKLARLGDASAYRFPHAQIKNSKRPLDLSYSGLKTAVILQHEQFLQANKEANQANLLASFQKVAVSMLVRRLEKAVQLTNIQRLVIGGGVAANSALRRSIEEHSNWESFIPSIGLCMDNAAMIAGLAYKYAQQNTYADLSVPAESRVANFRALK